MLPGWWGQHLGLLAGLVAMAAPMHCQDSGGRAWRLLVGFTAVLLTHAQPLELL